MQDRVSVDTPPQEALDYMRECGVGEMPVVAVADEDKVLGVLDWRLVGIRVSAEVVKRRQAAWPPDLSGLRRSGILRMMRGVCKINMRRSHERRSS